MTTIEKFRAGVVLTEINGEYVLELWGASTKHPDAIFHMRDFEMASWVDKNDPAQVKGQVFQWLLECASKLNYPPHAADLARYALKDWLVWENE